MRKVNALLASTVAATLMLAGCSSGDADVPGNAATQDGSGRDTTQLNVSVLPIATTAPIHLAQSEGLFEKVGLEVEISYATTGAAIVPSVLNGSVDIGYGNLISTIQAKAQGLPIVSIAESAAPSAEEGEEDTNWLLVRKDSGIERAEDLEGKTVAVNALNGHMDLTTRETVEVLGADPSTLKLVEIPFPEMLAALEAGRVDAVSTSEPFVSMGLSGGENTAAFRIGSIGETQPGVVADGYFTSESFLAENRDAVKRFREVIYEANALANESPDLAREAIAAYSQVPPDVLNVMTLPYWATKGISQEDYSYMADLMVKYGLIDEGAAPYDDVIALH